MTACPMIPLSLGNKPVLLKSVGITPRGLRRSCFSGLKDIPHPLGRGYLFSHLRHSPDIGQSLVNDSAYHFQCTGGTKGPHILHFIRENRAVMVHMTDPEISHGAFVAFGLSRGSSRSLVGSNCSVPFMDSTLSVVVLIPASINKPICPIRPSLWGASLMIAVRELMLKASCPKYPKDSSLYPL